MSKFYDNEPGYGDYKQPYYPQWSGYTADNKYFKSLKPKRRLFGFLGSTDPNDPNFVPYVSRAERRARKTNERQSNAIAKDDEKQRNKEDRQAQIENRLYRRNVRRNGLVSMFRRFPLFDSVQQYTEKLGDTPDYSGIENAKTYALKPTQVQRQSPSHISGNLKFNQYDYTGQANVIGSQIANGIDTISRRSSGNTNALIGHIGNLLAQKIGAVGNAYMNGFETNEKNRLNVAKENMEAEKYNATADNGAEQAYVSDLNATARQDKTNAINALDRYAQQKYMMDTNYENTLRGLRDQMASNIGEEGRTAYDNNRTNTNKEFNYWYDLQGNMHYIPQQGGVRYVESHDQSPYYVADGDFSKLLAKYSDDKVEGNKAIRDELYKMMNTHGYAQGRYNWYNKYKTA